MLVIEPVERIVKSSQPVSEGISGVEESGLLWRFCRTDSTGAIGPVGRLNGRKLRRLGYDSVGSLRLLATCK